MVNVKLAALLGAPILLKHVAATSATADLSRRHRLINLLQHMQEKRAEAYGVSDICTAEAGDNEATFNEVTDFPITFAAELTAYTYTSATGCINLDNCQQACIVDDANCYAIQYSSDDQTCKLLGLNYGGAEIAGQSSASVGYLAFLSNAGTTSASTGADSGETVPTCATNGMTPSGTSLDVQAEDGGCQCGAGRQQNNAFTCEIDGIGQTFQTTGTLTGPIEVYTAITWSDVYSAVSAVMTVDQCEAICDDDTECLGFYLQPGADLNECYKIGASGTYNDGAADFPFTPSTSSRKRQAAGQTGALGTAGGVFGETGAISTNAFATASAGARMRVKRVNNQVQW